MLNGASNASCKIYICINFGQKFYQSIIFNKECIYVDVASGFSSSLRI